MIALLINPHAGGGRALVHAHAVARALSAHETVEHWLTTGPGDERRCAAEACARGARVLAVVGGDGTVHHAARGLLDADAPVPLAVFSAGTGNDFVKSLGTPAHDPVAMAALVAAGRERTVDVGLIDEVPFLNAAGFGFDVEVLRRMQRRSPARLFGGTAAYVTTALGALLGFRGVSARWLGHERPHLITVFANGQWFGGAFRIAPHAELHDGLLDVVNIGAVPAWARPAVFLRAARGTHLGHRAVHHLRAAETTLHFREPPWFQADGELYQARSDVLTVRTQPRALRVIG